MADECICFTWQAKRRSAVINGQLFEPPGEKIINNRIALNGRLVSLNKEGARLGGLYAR